MWAGAAAARKQGADEEDGGEPPPSGRSYAWAPETAPTLKNTKSVCQGKWSQSFGAVNQQAKFSLASTQGKAPRERGPGS